ncbi:MAG: hypothetical protein ACUZ77_00755 [Candidatus Brocadiales bacterium]
MAGNIVSFGEIDQLGGGAKECINEAQRLTRELLECTQGVCEIYTELEPLLSKTNDEDIILAGLEKNVSNKHQALVIRFDSIIRDFDILKKGFPLPPFLSYKGSGLYRQPAQEPPLPNGQPAFLNTNPISHPPLPPGSFQEFPLLGHTSPTKRKGVLSIPDLVLYIKDKGGPEHALEVINQEILEYERKHGIFLLREYMRTGTEEGNNDILEREGKVPEIKEQTFTQKHTVDSFYDAPFFRITEKGMQSIPEDETPSVCTKMIMRFEEKLNTKKKANIFCKKKNVWVIFYNGEGPFYLENEKGLQYIERLLLQPKREFKALELYRLVEGVPPNKAGIYNEMNVEKIGEEGMSVSSSLSSKQEIIESMSIEDINKAIMACKEKITEAQADGSVESIDLVDLLQSEIKTLQNAKLKTNSRKVRNFIEDAEKVRKSVSIAITRSLEKIKKGNLLLYNHMDNSLTKGNILSYEPEKPTIWK